jgi:hypothetical protein
MIQLSHEQVAFILEDLKANGIDSEELRLSLLDHICCMIEEEMSPEQDFENFYQKVVPRFFKRDLREIQEETNLLLTFKHYYAMKKVMLISGTFTAFLFIVGAFFKFMHWPGASFLIVISITVLSFIFLPILFVFKVKEVSAKRDIITIGIATIFGILISLAALFKIMHWPGANVMWLSSLGILFFLFLPIFFFGGIRNAETKVNTIVSSILILVACGILFSLTSLRNSKWLDESIHHTYDLLQSSAELSNGLDASSVATDSASVQMIHESSNIICQNIQLVKDHLISKIPTDELGLKEGEIIRIYGENLETPYETLFNETGIPIQGLISLKQELKSYEKLIKSQTGLVSIPFLETNDTHRYGDPQEELLTWEETNFSHVTLATILRNLNLLMLNVRMIEKISTNS